MKLYTLLYSILFSMFFSACSHFTFNASMCDQIASDPNAQMPQECRNYVEEEAQKSFDNTKNESSKQEDERILQYQKEEEDK